MLEMARLIIDSNWVPPQPVIFLFNGAEELFLLVKETFFFVEISVDINFSNLYHFKLNILSVTKYYITAICALIYLV